MDRVNTLLAAGFSPDEVGAWSAQQRSTLGAGGFSEQEIDDHLGNRPRPVPPALISRMEWGKTLSQALKPVGAALDMMPNAQIARGLVQGAATNDEPAKAAGILDALGRVPEDMGWFVGRQVRHMFEGIPTPETAQRIGEGRGTTEEIVNMAAAALFTAGPVTRLPGGLTKVQRGPMGEVTSVPIGELPKAEDFAAARAAVTEGVPAPQVHAKLERLYDEHGIHPSEVAHDAAADVTIRQDLLASGDKLPDVYVRPDMPANAYEFERFTTPIIDEPGTGGFTIKRDGEPFAKMAVTVEGRNANIESITTNIDAGIVGKGEANLLGFREVRNIARAYFEANPGIETISGMRISGARAQERVAGGLDSDTVTVTRQQIMGRASGDRLPEAYVKPTAPVAPAEPTVTATVAQEAAASARVQQVIREPTAELKIADTEVHDSHGGEIFGMKALSDGGQIKAAADLSILPDEVRIQDIQTRADARRRGYADALVNDLFREFPGRKISTSSMTDEGAAFFRARFDIDDNGFITRKASAQPGLFARVLRDESGSMQIGRDQPPRTDAERTILSRLSIGETDAGRPWSWSSFYTAVVDRLNPIRDAVREAAPGAKLATADDPYQLARLYAGVSGKADHFLTYGTFDFGAYQPTGKGLKDIIAPVLDDLDGFRAFGTSLRALELEGRGIKTGMDLGAARTVAAEGQAKYAPIMADLVQYQNKLAIYLRDAGVLSREGYAAMRKDNQLYLPFQRVFGEVAGDIIPDVIRGQGTSLQASNPIHAIKGSERIVVDPLESIVRNTYLSLAMAERNAVGTKLVDLIQRAGDLPVPRHADTISIYRNGIKEEHVVSADLAAAIKGLDEETANTLLRLMGAPARALRAGATLTPEFMLRNPIRDFFGAVVNTTKGVFSPVDTARGLVSAFMKDADFQNWLKGGGANSALVSFDRRYLQQNIEQLTADTGLGTRAWNVVRHPIDTLRTISEISEQATRLGEFKGVQRQQLAAGASAKEAAQAAAYSSREVTVDFARRGAKTRAMNMITAFWNAGLQGTDRTIRAFRDDPGGTSLKMAAGITVPSVLLWWANHDDPRWQELPGWQRDLFWIVMTEDHVFRIPKPPGIGQMFGSSAEHLLDAYFDGRPDALKNFGKSVMSMMAMSFVPTFAAPVIEQWANRSTFTERTLIPADLEKQLPEYQYTPYTTETAKALGQIIGAFPGIRDAKLAPDSPALGGMARALSTPILMENYVRAWTGGLGTYALQIADAGLRKSGVLPDPVKPEDTLADIPFIKAFVVRYPSGSADSIQRFHDEYEKNRRYFDTWMAKAQEGDVVAMQHIQDMGGPRIFVQFDAIKEAVGEHSTLIRAIYKDPAISANEKRQLIDQLYYSEIQAAQAGIGAMREVSAALAP